MKSFNPLLITAAVSAVAAGLLLSLFMLRKHDDALIRKDLEIEMAKTRVEKAEALHAVAEMAYRKLKAETAEALARSERTILEIRKESERRRGEIERISLEVSKLRDEFARESRTFESLEDSAIASQTQTASRETYPRYPDAAFVFDPQSGFFQSNRSFANSVRLSFEEVTFRRKENSSLSQITVLETGRRSDCERIVLEKDVQISGFKADREGCERLANARLALINEVRGERKLWEEKSELLEKKIFWYKWGIRVGVGAAVAGAVAFTILK